MDWHPWNTHPKLNKNFRGKKKTRSGLTGPGKKQQTKSTKQLRGKKRYKSGQLKEKKMEDNLTKRQGGKDRPVLKLKKNCQVKRKLFLPENSAVQNKPSVSAKTSGIYAPLLSSDESESDESEIELLEEPCTSRAILPPVIDLTIEDDATTTEDILLLCGSNLDDSVMLIRNVINKQKEDPLRNTVEDTTGILNTDFIEIPDLQKAVHKGKKRHRTSSFLTEAITGTGSQLRAGVGKASTCQSNVLGIDTANKKKRTSFTDYSSPLIKRQSANKQKETRWDTTSKQLHRTIENNLVVQQPVNLSSSAFRDHACAGMSKAATDNGAKPCSKENVDPANRVQNTFQNTSATQPIGLSDLSEVENPCEAISENIAETCSEEIVALRDTLSDTNSNEIQNIQRPVAKKITETCSKETPDSVLPDIEVVSETYSAAAKETNQKSRKKRHGKNTSTGTFLPVPVIENASNIQNINKAQGCVMVSSAPFNANAMQCNVPGVVNSNTFPPTTQFANFNEAQERRIAVQNMLRGSHVHSSIPRNLVYSLRPIVIDGSNVARSHGSTTGAFSCRGIAICIEHFLSRGHTQVTALVPQFRRNLLQNQQPVTDQWMLEDLAKRQLVAFTPSRTVNRRTIASYDDRFIVDLACRNGGIIVSNDNFRDIAKENNFWQQTVHQRLLMYVFVGDIFMIPEDPFGRNGPMLKDFLSFPRS